jgi:hypothetical protein
MHAYVYGPMHMQVGILNFILVWYQWKMLRNTDKDI